MLLVITAVAKDSFPQLNYQNISFEEAILKSKQTGQFIFIQVESPTCLQCNEVAEKGFQNKELSEQLENTFICIKITSSHPDRNQIESLYNMKNGFGTLFIGNDKTLIHSFPRTTTLAAEYKKQIDIFFDKAGESMKITELEKEYKSGNKSPGIMELLLLKRKSLNLETASLLDEYVTLLPEDSLKSERTLLFIAQMAPIIGTKADNQLRKNMSVFNKAWYRMPVAQRVNINNRIIYTSMKKAIEEKNESFAYQVATFARNTNDNNTQAGIKAYDMNMLNYYRETNDTINYLVRAIYYYDNYYMTVKPDSVKRKDSLRLNPLSVTVTGDGMNTKKTITYAPIAQNFTRDLNNGAWSFYKMTSDLLHLKKALQWAKRANDFFDSPEAMDTYARLLYRTGSLQEAIDWETKAIDLRKKQGYNPKEYETILESMKKNARID
jgi:thioredoxin-related protein/tetratricopeptide (TPR) repeat protein